MKTTELFSRQPVSQDDIIRFIVPPFSPSRVVFATGDIMRQSYYHNYDYPGYIFMREEYGLLSRPFSFLTYIFEVKGYNLFVLSCTEHNRFEITGFNSGYDYIRLPVAVGCTKNWEYRVSEEIRVICHSVLTLRDIEGRSCRELQVDRRMLYCDGRFCSETHSREYYIEGLGIVGIQMEIKK